PIVRSTHVSPAVLWEFHKNLSLGATHPRESARFATNRRRDAGSAHVPLPFPSARISGRGFRGRARPRRRAVRPFGRRAPPPCAGRGQGQAPGLRHLGPPPAARPRGDEKRPATVPEEVP